MGRITSFSKQVIVFFLVTALIIRPTFAANVGGWTLGGGVAQGASTVYEGTKKVIIDGKDYIKKGTAKITPPASSVSKVLARGAAGYALSVAVEQLLGAVDWVLDPANNQILYTDPNSPPNNQYGWPFGGIYYSTAQQACDAALSANFDAWGKPDSVKAIGDSTSVICYKYGGPNNFAGNSTIGIGYAKNPAYDPDAVEEEQKRLPLDVVSQQVISNAAAGDVNAQVATTGAAADIVAEAETDKTKAPPIVNQLEQSASTQNADADAQADANTATGSQTQNPSKPDTTDLKLEFPAFCGWAPVVCEAAQTVISFPTTLADWWNTGKTKAEEWALSISEAWAKVKEEYYDQPEENTDTELEIPDLEQDIEVDTDISFGGSCPAPLSSDINFMGLNKTIEFSFDPVCQIAEFIKPVVISISAFSAALIVAGIRTEDD